MATLEGLKGGDDRPELVKKELTFGSTSIQTRKFFETGRVVANTYREAARV